MPTRDQLYQALRNADAAGDTEGVRKLAAYIKTLPAQAAPSQAAPEPQFASVSELDDKQLKGAFDAAVSSGNQESAHALYDEMTARRNKRPKVGTAEGAAKGSAVGLADIGNTVINAALALPSKFSPDLAQWNRVRNADLEYIADQNKDSTAFKVGRVGTNVVATMPVGGVIGGLVKAVAPTAAASMPIVNRLVQSISTGGFRTGAPAATSVGGKFGDLAVRSVGGGVTGGASSALINPDDAGTGAITGAVLPPALAGAGKVAGHIGRSIGSLVKPFTEAGRDDIARAIIQRFSQGGPTALNAAEIVPGSAPTLAEATGNAGLATLQRGARDISPNKFLEREAQNMAARNEALKKVAGTEADLIAAKAARSNNAADDYLKTQIGIPTANTEYEALKQTPAFRAAFARAQAMAKNANTSIETTSQNVANANLGGAAGKSKNYVSGQGLQIIKEALDDQIDKALRAGATKQAESVRGVKDRLVTMMDREIPGYADARAAYSSASRPIDAMEFLQGIKVGNNATGDMTLNRVQNVLDNIKALKKQKGVNQAKSVTDEQIAALTQIRDDLLRQSNTALGKSLGSNTFQNIATDNILNSMVGNSLSRLADKAGVSGLLGQVGRVAYSGPNEAIRNRLVDMMLQPQLAEQAFIGAAQVAAPNRLNQLILPRAGQLLYRTAPALSASQ